MPRASAPTPPPADLRESRASACVAEVRRSLVSTYPRIDVEGVVAIAQGYGSSSLPDALLIAGDAEDPGPNGLRSHLEYAGRVGSDGMDPHPLFSKAYYDFKYPGVADEAIPAWVHYHRWGVQDGLSPHFLLDVEYLAQSLARVPRPSLLDRYLDDPDAWFVGPSPYVEIEKFVLSGAWDGVSHPLVQIVLHRRDWLQSRLMVIDSAWGSSTQARLNAAAFLLSAPSAAAAVSPLVFWSEGTKPSIDSDPDRGAVDLIVVPGFVVESAGRIRWRMGDAMVSADHSVVAVDGGCLAMAAGEHVSVDTLVVVLGPLDRARIVEIVEALPASSAVAPFDAAQNQAFRRAVRLLGASVLVLDVGAQARVTATEVRSEPAGAEHREDWDRGADCSPPSLVFVLPRSDPYRPLAPDIDDLVSRGSALCIVTGGRLDEWAVQIEREGVLVVVDETLFSAARAFSRTRPVIVRGVSAP